MGQSFFGYGKLGRGSQLLSKWMGMKRLQESIALQRWRNLHPFELEQRTAGFATT